MVVHAPAKLEGDAQVALVDQVAKMGLETERMTPSPLGLGQIDLEQAGNAEERLGGSPLAVGGCGRWPQRRPGRAVSDGRRRGTGGEEQARFSRRQSAQRQESQGRDSGWVRQGQIGPSGIGAAGLAAV